MSAKALGPTATPPASIAAADTESASTSGSEHARPVGGGRRRGLRVVTGIVIAGICLGAGWVAAERFESPAQRAAAAAPPLAGPVVATVARGALRQEFTVEATVSTSHEQKVSVDAASGGVVTRVGPRRGDAVRAGDVLVAVNDRPVFVLPGKFTFYRDLTPGDTGADVTQLQAGLRAAGHPVAAVEDGRFGATTAAAVRSLYANAGFPVATATVPATAPASATTDEPPADDEAPGVPATRIVVPAAEVTVARTLPAVVGTMPAVGAKTTDGLSISLLSGSPRARAEIPSTVLAQVTTNTRGTVQTDDGTTIPVKVAKVTSSKDDDTGGTLELKATKGHLPAAGTRLLAALTVTAAADDALVVPSRAVAVDAGGTAHVLRRDGTGFALVDVRVAGELAGQTALSPDGALAAGDVVKVG